MVAATTLALSCGAVPDDWSGETWRALLDPAGYRFRRATVEHPR